MTREQVFELIDQTIFQNTQRQISEVDLNNLLKTIYDSVQINSSLKRYRARISAGGTISATADPNIVVYENSIGTLTWDNIALGDWRLNSSNLFPANKTFIMFTQGSGSVLNHYTVARISTSSVQLRAWSSSGTATNNTMTDCFIEIIVYP
jgi:hypothetical protein